MSVSLLNSWPCALQPLLEREEVLDDAVVDDDDVARAVAMRMGVVLVRLAVRGPARVAHAERAVQLLSPTASPSRFDSFPSARTTSTPLPLTTATPALS